MDKWVEMVMLMVMVIGAVGVVGGQDTSCLKQLMPCLNYLNGTKDVPSVCCDPLKNVIQTEPECLCSMISNRGSKQAEQAGINVTEAQQLPARCGLRVNPIGCLTGSSSNNNNKNNNSVDASSSDLVRIPTSRLLAVATAFSMAMWSLWC